MFGGTAGTVLVEPSADFEPISEAEVHDVDGLTYCRFTLSTNLPKVHELAEFGGSLNGSYFLLLAVGASSEPERLLYHSLRVASPHRLNVAAAPAPATPPSFLAPAAGPSEPGVLRIADLLSQRLRAESGGALEKAGSSPAPPFVPEFPLILDPPTLPFLPPPPSKETASDRGALDWRPNDGASLRTKLPEKSKAPDSFSWFHEPQLATAAPVPIHPFFPWEVTNAIQEPESETKVVEVTTSAGPATLEGEEGTTEEAATDESNHLDDLLSKASLKVRNEQSAICDGKKTLQAAEEKAKESFLVRALLRLLQSTLRAHPIL